MQKLRLIFLKTIGISLLLVGIVAAYYGPLEIFVFYFFSEGGQFHYDGFGFGSLWFAVLVIQNISYYVVAALCIPIGIGHLKLRRWALTLTKLYIWFWLGAGILLTINLFLMIPAVLNLELSRDELLTRLLTICVFALITLILLPSIACWIYNGEKLRAIFENSDPNFYWTERYPFPLMALLLLFAIMILVMHIAIFFQSLFPLFGKIMLGRPAVYIVALCILTLGILTYGIVLLKKWAWWGSLVYLSLLSSSSLMSFSRYSFYDLVLILKLPAYEMEVIDKITLLHDFYLVALLSAPLLIALGLLIFSKKYFQSN